jgi:hypothetical protein
MLGLIERARKTREGAAWFCERCGSVCDAACRRRAARERARDRALTHGWRHV